MALPFRPDQLIPIEVAGESVATVEARARVRASMTPTPDE